MHPVLQHTLQNLNHLCKAYESENEGQNIGNHIDKSDSNYYNRIGEFTHYYMYFYIVVLVVLVNRINFVCKAGIFVCHVPQEEKLYPLSKYDARNGVFYNNFSNSKYGKFEFLAIEQVTKLCVWFSKHRTP